MAETVKKSRIVSDDDLEESLMQEFNIRLKHCMSQEQVQETNNEHEEEEENIKETIKMEFNNSATTNGKNEDTIYDEVSPINSSEKFLNEERSVYVDTKSVSLKNGLSDVHSQNLNEDSTMIQEQNPSVQITEDVIYDEVKNVRPVLQLPTTCLEDMSDAVELDSQDNKTSVKDRMFLSTDDTSCLLFTQTVTSPMLTPSEENIDFLKGFQRQSSQNTTSASDNTASENTASSKVEDADQPNEDVTETSNISDKLEIEYENIQLANTEGEISEVDNIATINVIERNPIATEEENAQTECIYENIEDDDERQEQIYENMEILRRQSNSDKQSSSQEFLEREIAEEQKSRFEDNIYENVEDTEEEDIELSNAESIEDLQSKEEKSIPDVCLEANEKVDNASNYSGIENEEVIVNKPDSPIAQINTLPDETEASFNEPKQENISEFEETPVTQCTDDLINSTDENPETAHENKNGNFGKETVILDFDVEDKSLDNPSKMVDALKTKFMSNATAEVVKTASIEKNELNQLKTVDIMKHISKFEQKSPRRDDEDEDTSSSTEMTESTFVETTMTTSVETSSSIQDKSLKKKKSKKSRTHDKENISVKSSFNKFDALQKKNVLHVRSSDSSKAQEKFNGAAPIDSNNCKACGKVVFQMEQIKAEKSVWHKNCFRCQECSKQLTVDTYQSNEGTVYCKPHFKSLFAPKTVEDEAPPKPRKHELIIRENQPLELPPDVVRASDKPDLGLEELQSLNVRERFQVFEHHEEQNASNNIERGQVNVKRSPSILSKLAKFQSKGMDVGVTDDSLNGIPIEESSTEEDQEEDEIEGEDADLIRAKRAQKEKPFHFTGMSDVKSKWEHGEQNTRDVRREERKQEIQSIRDRLFMGKQGKMKEAYQQAVMESESCSNMKKLDSPPVEACDTRSLKEKFEKGEAYEERKRDSKDAEDMSVFESGISKKSRSIFLELDANASKPPQLSPVSPQKPGSEVRKAREAFMARQASEDTVKSSEQVDDIKVETSDIQQRFKFFETYKEPEKKRKAFRITPPREGQVKTESPEREVYRDPDIARSEEQIEDSVIAKETHTATKVLNKFRQMEENLNREPLNLGPKPLKRFTPPPEPTRPESRSESEGSESDEESEELEEFDQSKMQDADLVEAQKAARARQLRAKFEKWEAKEIKREQQQVNLIEEVGDEQAQIETTKALRARFESLKDNQNEVRTAPRVKVNRFV